MGTIIKEGKLDSGRTLTQDGIEANGIPNKLVMPESLAPSGVETAKDSESVRPCSGLRVDLKRCLLTTECCTERNKTPLECLQTNDVPQECQALRVAFFECKRSILDMRTRFRGRKGY